MTFIWDKYGRHMGDGGPEGDLGDEFWEKYGL